jgi:hypothetical protein
MATGDDNDDGNGQPFAPHERFLDDGDDDDDGDGRRQR